MSFLLVVGLIVRRAYGVWHERRWEAAATRLRPVAIDFVYSEDAPAPQLHGLDAEVFASLLGGYARLLRGAASARIAAYLADSGAVERQLRRLRSVHAWRRASAAFELGDMRAERATPQLLNALENDKRRDVRKAAARSLGRIGAIEAIEPMIDAAIAGRVPPAVVGLSLLDLGPAAVPRLAELSAADDPRVRAGAIELIGLLGAAGDSTLLLERMTDPSADVRAGTATALGRLGAADARDALIRALDDRLPAVRAAAADALGHTGGRSAAEALLPVARGDEFDVARAASRSLARIDPGRVVTVGAEADAGPHLREAADRIVL